MLIRKDRAMLAVTVVLDVAFHAGRSGMVNAAELAGRLGLVRRGMEPLLQALSRAGLLESIRGPRGGYRLGRPGRDIRVSDILSAVAGDEESGRDTPEGPLHRKVVAPLWAEAEAAALASLRALSVEDLLRRAAGAGLNRPAREPITFAI